MTCYADLGADSLPGVRASRESNPGGCEPLRLKFAGDRLDDLDDLGFHGWQQPDGDICQCEERPRVDRRSLRYPRQVETRNRGFWVGVLGRYPSANR